MRPTNEENTMLTEREVKRARHLFTKEEQLNIELRAIDTELTALRVAYMRAEKVCGLDKLKFKREILK